MVGKVHETLPEELENDFVWVWVYLAIWLVIIAAIGEANREGEGIPSFLTDTFIILKKLRRKSSNATSLPVELIK